MPERKSLLDWTDDILATKRKNISEEKIRETQVQLGAFLATFPFIKSEQLQARLCAISSSSHKYREGPIRPQAMEGKTLRVLYQPSPDSRGVVVEITIPEYRHREVSIAGLRRHASWFNQKYFPHWQDSGPKRQPMKAPPARRNESRRQTKPNGIHNGHQHARTF